MLPVRKSLEDFRHELNESSAVLAAFRRRFIKSALSLGVDQVSVSQLFIGVYYLFTEIFHRRRVVL